MPPAFVKRMKTQLGNEYEDFVTALNAGGPTSVRINTKKLTLPKLPPVKWHPQGFYLDHRPTFAEDPLWHAGGYYVQEASSMAIREAIRQHIPLEEPLRALDLCGAPGGKSTTLLDVLGPNSLLVANEVVKSRAHVLAENITKWGSPNTVVTHNDPAIFQQLPHFFDLLLVDAPCSGEGLFRKDPNARSEWSTEHVTHCSLRQQRILGDVWDSLAPGGWMIYSTCTYNHEENEEVLRWLCHTKGATTLPIQFPQHQRVSPTQDPHLHAYRFYPHATQGEGFFMSILRKDGDREVLTAPKMKKPKLSLASRAVLDEIVEWWSPPGQADGFWQGDTFVGFAKEFLPWLDVLSRKVYILQAGTPLWERTKKKPTPTVGLGLSPYLVKDNFHHVSLSLEQALSFLRKEDIHEPEWPIGWVLASFQGVSIGWLKVMPNRANNYWPTHWRFRSALSSNIGWSLAQHL